MLERVSTTISIPQGGDHPDTEKWIILPSRTWYPMKTAVANTAPVTKVARGAQNSLFHLARTGMQKEAISVLITQRNGSFETRSIWRFTSILIS